MKVWYETVFGSLQRTIFIMILGLIMVPTMILGVISYNQYRKIITENATHLNRSNVTQIASNIESIMMNIRNTSLSFYQNDSVRDFLLADSNESAEIAWQNLNQYILNQLSYEEYIYAVDFVRTDGIAYSSSSVTDGISQELQQELIKKKGRAVFLTEVGLPAGQGGSPEELCGYARCINDITDIGTPIGFQKIYIKKEVLLRLLSDYIADEEAYYLIEDGLIRISTDPAAQGKRTADCFPDLLLDRTDGAGMNLVYSRVRYPQWYIVKRISPLQVEDDSAVVRQLLISTGILAVALCGFMGFFLSRFVIKPLAALEFSMRHIEDNNFKQKLPEQGYREINVLAKSFNRMTDRLDELVNRVYRAEIREKDAQIRAMQAYINPHFLYNTLDTICWMSRMEQAYETCGLIEALSKLFRSSVKDTGKTTTVAGEMEHIRNYIRIHECRHSDSLDFDLYVEPGTEDCETVRFVLQPLVENAIVHGMEANEMQGTISVRAERRDDDLVLTVTDEGCGADIMELEQLLSSDREGLRGMAISNVNERIKLCFGEQYGIRFHNRPAGGLAVEVIQPYRKRGTV